MFRCLLTSLLRLLLGVFGIFKQSGHTKEQVSAWLASGGIESSKQITQNEYEAICERLADPRPLL